MRDPRNYIILVLILALVAVWYFWPAEPSEVFQQVDKHEAVVKVYRDSLAVVKAEKDTLKNKLTASIRKAEVSARAYMIASTQVKKLSDSLRVVVQPKIDADPQLQAAFMASDSLVVLQAAQINSMEDQVKEQQMINRDLMDLSESEERMFNQIIAQKDAEIKILSDEVHKRRPRLWKKILGGAAVVGAFVVGTQI